MAQRFALYWLTRVLLRQRLRWYFRLSATGLENVPHDGPFMIAANHASYIDPWLIGAVFPQRLIRYLITVPWYDRSPVWRGFFESNGVIPTTYEDPIGTIRRVVDALREGAVVGMFPEGAISPDGKIRRGRVGIAWMAACSGAPIVPCGIRGSHEALPRGRRWPSRHPVHMNIGPPVTFGPAVPEATTPEAIAAFVSSLMQKICELAGQPDQVPQSAARPAVDLRPQLERARILDGARDS